MSNNASVMFRTQFADRAMHIYQQRGGRLRGSISRASRFNGSSEATYYLAGKMKAYETTAAGQKNVPSGMGITKFTVPLRTWTVYEHINEYDLDRMSIDEKELIFDAAAMAMGRTTDIEVYQAAFAKVTAVTSGCDFSSNTFRASAAQTMIKALQGQLKVWDGNVFCALPEQAWNELMLTKAFYQADAVGSDRLPFASMTQSKFWNGVNWFLYVEDTAEDMFPSSGAGKQDILMYHQSALGWAAHSEFEEGIKMQWHNDIDAHSFNMKLKGNATTLQEGNGIVRARVRSTGTLAIQDV